MNNVNYNVFVIICTIVIYNGDVGCMIPSWYHLCPISQIEGNHKLLGYIRSLIVIINGNIEANFKFWSSSRDYK